MFSSAACPAPLMPSIAPKPSSWDHLRKWEEKPGGQAEDMCSCWCKHSGWALPYHFSGRGKCREVNVSGVHVMQTWIGQYGAIVLLKWVVLRNFRWGREGNGVFCGTSFWGGAVSLCFFYCFSCICILRRQFRAVNIAMIYFFFSIFLFSFLKRVSPGQHGLENGWVLSSAQNSLSQKELAFSYLCDA